MRTDAGPPLRRTVFYLVLATLSGAFFVALNQPGLLNADGLAQWYQGRFKSALTDPRLVHPPFMSLIWSAIDAVDPDPLSMLLLQTLLLALVLFFLLRWLGPSPLAATAAAVVLLCNPFVFANGGKLVKDVFGAHCLLLAFVLQPNGRLDRPDPPFWPALVGGAMAAVAVLSRYQFVVAVPFLIVAASWEAGYPRMAWRQGARVIVGFIAAAAVLSITTHTVLDLKSTDVAGSFRKIALFDIGGVLSRVPDADIAPLANAGIDSSAFRRLAIRDYSPIAVDMLWANAGDNAFDLLEPVATRDVLAQWFHFVLHEPAALMIHHLNTYSHVLGLQDLYPCDVLWKNQFWIPPEVRPIMTPLPDGSVDPAVLLPPAVARLFDWRHYPVNFIGHRAVAYIVVGLVLIGLLWKPPPLVPSVRQRATLMPLVAAGIVYHLTFLIMPQHCQVRYSYFTATAVVVAWVALGLTLLAKWRRWRRTLPA